MFFTTRDVNFSSVKKFFNTLNFICSKNHQDEFQSFTGTTVKMLILSESYLVIFHDSCLAIKILTGFIMRNYQKNSEIFPLFLTKMWIEIRIFCLKKSFFLNLSEIGIFSNTVFDTNRLFDVPKSIIDSYRIKEKFSI